MASVEFKVFYGVLWNSFGDVSISITLNCWWLSELFITFSFSSSEWNSVAASERPNVSAEDGEFWCVYKLYNYNIGCFIKFHTLRIICFLCLFRMSFTDFLSHYSRIEICTLTPDTITSDSVKHWAVTNHDGTWRKGSTAGGCRNNPCEPQKNCKHTLKHCESDSDFSTKNDSHGQSLVVLVCFII